jgi:hypothetical protein
MEGMIMDGRGIKLINEELLSHLMKVTPIKVTIVNRPVFICGEDGLIIKEVLPPIEVENIDDLLNQILDSNNDIKELFIYHLLCGKDFENYLNQFKTIDTHGIPKTKVDADKIYARYAIL